MTSLSTRELMRLVVLAALNLLLFQGVWWIMIYPPVALVIAILNLALFCTCVRPRSLNRGVIAALGGGLIVALGVAAYLAEANFRPRLAVALLDCLPAALDDRLPAAVRSSSAVQFLDFALLDGLGAAAMALSGWLAWPRHRPRLEASERHSARPSPETSRRSPLAPGTRVSDGSPLDQWTSGC
jgi:hypothetical protein